MTSSAGARHRPDHLLVDLNPMGPFLEEPFVLVEGQGIRLVDDRGREYIDGLSGAFVVSVGHGNEAVVAAAAEQAQRLAFAQPFYATTPPAIALADRLSELSPPGLEYVRLTAAGSEATESAIKLARQLHLERGEGRRFKVLSHHRGYHGSTGFALAASGNTAWKRAFEPYPGGFVHVHAPFSLQKLIPALADDPEAAAEAALALLRETIEREAPETIAAFITEPVMLSAGMRVPPPGYLPRLVELCHRYDIVVIFDEIITGFGRTGRMFASEHFEAVPDILCIGKGVSGGYAALAGFIANERVAGPFMTGDLRDQPFLDAHTYGNNPVAAAVGLAVLQQIEDRGLVQAAEERGAQLAELLRAPGLPAVREVRGIGLLVAVELEGVSGQRVWEEARGRGLICRYGEDFVVLGPPLVVSADEVTEIADILLASVAAVA